MCRYTTYQNWALYPTKTNFNKLSSLSGSTILFCFVFFFLFRCWCSFYLVFGLVDFCFWFCFAMLVTLVLPYSLDPKATFYILFWILILLFLCACACGRAWKYWIRPLVSAWVLTLLVKTYFTFDRSFPTLPVNPSLLDVGPSREIIRCLNFSLFVCFMHITQNSLLSIILSRWAWVPPCQPVLVLVESPDRTRKESTAPCLSRSSYRDSATFLAGLSGWTALSGVKCPRYLPAGSRVTLTCSSLMTFG